VQFAAKYFKNPIVKSTFILRFLFIFLVCFRFGLNAQNSDLKLLKHINVNRDQSLDPFFTQVSFSGYWLSISYPISTLGRGYFTKDSGVWERGVTEIAGSALCLGLTLGLKHAIQRKRPYQLSTEIQPILPLPNPNSMPSGHTSAAFSTATHISMAWPKWYVVVPAYGWAGLVGYSRMFGGYHYPTDVLAGAFLGAGTAWLSHKASNWLIHKKQKKLYRPF
jgi:membrane-associated phospholipid phosphatase